MQDGETTYKARIRFHCAPGTRFSVDSATCSFGENSTLKTPDGKAAIRDSEWLVLEFGGIPSEAKAIELGERAKSALVWAGLCCKMGVDVGHERTTFSLAKRVRDAVFAKTGVQMRASVHGLDVYDESVPTSFPVFSGTGTVSHPLQPFVARFAEALQLGISMRGDRQEVACAVYLSAYYQSCARAKLLMLVSAVEALAEAPKLGVRADRLRRILMYLTGIGRRLIWVPKDEAESLHGALMATRRASVRQSCRRLIELHLPEHEVDSRPAAKFFDSIYVIRSAIVHSGGDGVDDAEVQRVNPMLDQFVSQLIQANIKGNSS